MNRLITLTIIVVWAFGLIPLAQAQDILETYRTPPGKRLCVIGNEILALEDAECVKRQEEERSRNNIVSDVLDDTPIEVPFKLLDVDLLEGITLGAQYKFGVQPSYRDDFFTRVDRYNVTAAIDPGDIVGDLPFLMAIDSGSQLVFVQQFASGRAARNIKNAYLPDRIPINSEKALSLKVGDYVRFDAKLSLLTSLGQAFPLAYHILAGKLGVSALVSGDYQVHVFRLDGDRVRIKLVGDRVFRRSASAGIGRVRGLEVLGVNQALKKVVSLAELDHSIQVAIGKTNTRVFLVDYTLDLGEPAVREAYDSIFASPRRLKSVQVSETLQDNDDFSDRVIGNLEPLDTLARESIQNSFATPVVRNFKGSNFAKSRHIDLQLNLKSYNVTRERVFRENFLTRSTLQPNGSEVTDHFLLPSWSRIRERSALFGRLNEDMQRTADALFVADENGEPLRFLNIGFGFDYRDSRMRDHEYRRMRNKLALLLPPDGEAALKETLAGTRWLTDETHKNMRMSLRYFFRESAFDGLVAAGFGDRDAIEDAIYGFIAQEIENGDYPYYDGDTQGFIKHYSAQVRLTGRERRNPDRAVRKIVKVLWGKRIESVSDNLSVAFDANNNNKTRMLAVTDLRNSDFYRRVGTSIWMHMIEQAKLDLGASMYLELTLEGEDHQGIRFEYGQPEERNLYEAVKFIEQILGQRGPDMREEGAIDSLISRMTLVTN